MNHPPVYRFAVNAAPQGSGTAFADFARKLEELGFDAIFVPDGPSHAPAVFPTLAWAAASTTRLRIGTYVIANDLHHPFHIAHNAATLHQLSGGRAILGIGAGRPGADAEYAALGKTIDTPGHRITRLLAAISIIRQLLHGETVTWQDDDYTMHDATLPSTLLESGAPPLLIAGSGPRLLTLAGAQADIVAIGAAPHADSATLSNLVSHVEQGAANRADKPERNISLNGAGDRLAGWFSRMPAGQRQHLLESNSPTLLFGSTEAMIEGLHQRYTRFGITSYTIPQDLVDVMAPVIAGVSSNN